MSEYGSICVSRLGPPVTEIRLSGEIDIDVSPAVLDLVTQVREAESPVHLDAQGLTFIDASGLRAITELGTCNGHRPVLVNPPRILQFLLEVTRADRLFTVVQNDREPEPTG